MPYPLAACRAAGVLGGGAATVDHDAAVLNLFSSLGTDVAVFKEAADTYILAVGIGGRLYHTQRFALQTPTGSTGIRKMTDTEIRKGCAGTNQENGSVTKSGTWTLGSNATYYGGNYRYATAAGAYCEFTTPAGMTNLYMHHGAASNAGILLVTIDGDNTLASALSTAQDLVNAAVVANTVLVANGGSLNPTDRVIDGFAYTAADVITLMEGIAAGAHVIRVTVTGYKNTGSSAARGYCAGFGYSNAASVATDSGFSILKKVASIWSAATSEQDMAINCVPVIGGSTNVFVGTGHGYESDVSLVVSVDGAEKTLTNNVFFGGTASAKIVRTTTLTHPDITPTKIADIVHTYEMTPANGLSVAHAITWAVDVNIYAAYIAMWPGDAEIFTKASYKGEGTDVACEADTPNGKAQWGWRWAGSGGRVANLVYIPDVAVSVDNWANIDGSGRALLMGSKVYVSKASKTPGTLAVAAAAVWNSEVHRRVRYFVDADASLAR